MKKVVLLALVMAFAVTYPAHSKKTKYRNYCCECPWGDPPRRFEVRVRSKLTGIRKCKELCGFDYDDPQAISPAFKWGNCPPDPREEGGP